MGASMGTCSSDSELHICDESVKQVFGALDFAGAKRFDMKLNRRGDVGNGLFPRIPLTNDYATDSDGIGDKSVGVLLNNDL
jgi:hypothetical protein